MLNTTTQVHHKLRKSICLMDIVKEGVMACVGGLVACSFCLGQCRDGHCCLCICLGSSHPHNQTRPAVTAEQENVGGWWCVECVTCMRILSASLSDLYVVPDAACRTRCTASNMRG